MRSRALDRRRFDAAPAWYTPTPVETDIDDTHLLDVTASKRPVRITARAAGIEARSTNRQT